MRALTNAQTATVLAALRIYQREVEHNAGLPPKLVRDIASDGDTLDPLSVDEIDLLCELINT